jgi:c-di-AMP phosphodiesterase-like protein
MTPHEFSATMNTFNTAAWHYPPPKPIGTGSLNYYLLCLSCVILISIIIAIHYTHQIALILLLPFSFLVFSTMIIYWRRRKMSRVCCNVIFVVKNRANMCANTA